MEIAPWNITTGCERLTPGCDNCPTYWDSHKNGWDYHPSFNLKELSTPLDNKVPTAYMVSIGSDLFHEAIRLKEIASVFNVMRLATWHHFEVVTKRIERMEVISRRDLRWPKNAMAGVAIEGAKHLWRLDCLKDIDARRFVSFGPMVGRIGKVDLTGIEVAGVVVEDWGKPRAVEPEWIDEIYEQCEKFGVGISKETVLAEGGV